jgi:hypothetical protein
MAGKKKTSHHLNVSIKKALITHLDFDTKVMASFFADHCTRNILGEKNKYPQKAPKAPVY